MGEKLKRDILVLMSTYNGGKYLKEQLDSILAQQGCEVHILIRDDGSKDSTLAIIKSYRDKYNNISFVCDNENLGPALSFLKLVSISPDYDYYAFADQDDIWDCDKLSLGIDSIKDQDRASLYCSNLRLVDANGKDLNTLAHNDKIFFDYETVLCSGQFTGCTMVFNHKLAVFIKSANSPKTVIMHDHYLTSVCALVDGYIFYDHLPHISYRQHLNNVIGIKTNVIGKINNRLEYILKKKKVNLYDQAKEWLSLYGEFIDNDKKNFLRILIGTKHNIFCRLKLAFSKRIHYSSINLSITNRMAFLFGKK